MDEIQRINTPLFNTLITSEQFTELSKIENLHQAIDKHRIDLRVEIQKNIENKYNQYIDSFRINLLSLDSYHRYIDVSKFITSDIMNEFTSVYSNYIIATLLESLDEKNPLLVVTSKILKEEIVNYSDINIILDSELSLKKLYSIITYYRTLIEEAPLTFEINGTIINPTQWNPKYIEILLQYNPDDEYKKYETILTEYIVKNHIKKLCTIAQDIIIKLRPPNTSLNEKSKQDLSTKLVDYTDLLEFNFLDNEIYSSKIYSGGGYSKKITNTINGKRKHIKKQTQKKTKNTIKKQIKYNTYK